MRRLFFDLETTGLPGRGVPVYIVQIAWILDDSAGVTRQSGNFLIRPEGWTIPEEVVRIHGITTETALAFGIDEQEALTMFFRACCDADVVAAHNIQFDWPIVCDRAQTRIPIPDVELFCTQKRSIGLVPNGSVRGPKLVDAYRHFTGLALDGAHDAMNDTLACRAVYYGLQKATACPGEPTRS